MRRTAWLAIVLATATSLTSCVGPARTGSAYRDKAETSAASALSAARTGQLAAHVAQQEGVFSPQLSIVLSDAADEAAYAEQTFRSIQPPDASLDPYRSQVLSELTRAADALANMRIAARRTDTASLISHAEPLSEIAASLERLAGSQA